MTDFTSIALLQDLLRERQIDAEQSSIAIKVLAGGIDSLDEREAALYKALLLQFLAPICAGCGFVIAASEVRVSWANGGFCSLCAEAQHSSATAG